MMLPPSTLNLAMEYENDPWMALTNEINTTLSLRICTLTPRTNILYIRGTVLESRVDEPHVYLKTLGYHGTSFEIDSRCFTNLLHVRLVVKLSLAK